MAAGKTIIIQAKKKTDLVLRTICALDFRRKEKKDRIELTKIVCEARACWSAEQVIQDTAKKPQHF